MKIAIVGLANSGKTTIFNALTGLNLETTVYPSMPSEPNIGIVKVPDSRIDSLGKMFMPKKITYAAIEYVDYLSLTKGDMEQNRKVFNLIKDADALVHVIRGFEDDLVIHPLEGMDCVRDSSTLELEMIFGDLELVEKRLERMEQGVKRGKKPEESEKQLLLKCRNALEKETPLRTIFFDEEEKKAMKHLQFMSLKPEVVVLNIEEKEIVSEQTTEQMSKVNELFSEGYASVLNLCGKIEMEMTRLSAEEARLFLDDLKISEPALNRLIKVSYELLGLISFITVGEDEVRAWTIVSGTTAQKAAGKIHSDIERGFIRAEVISYKDFSEAGSMAAARDKGLLRLEGKNYQVRDGDIINFRFNV